MLININKKPIKVTEETEESPKSITYFTVSTIGYLLSLWMMDYVCFTMFNKHPLPWITWIGKIISFIGGLI